MKFENGKLDFTDGDMRSVTITGSFSREKQHSVAVNLKGRCVAVNLKYSSYDFFAK